MLIINPGSGPVEGGTFEQAVLNAETWLENMQADGVTDVKLIRSAKPQGDGRYVFTFEHNTTGVTATLETHGLTQEQVAEHTFPPRVYWRGSSSAEPCLEDFLTDGYRIAIVPA